MIFCMTKGSYYSFYLPGQWNFCLATSKELNLQNSSDAVQDEKGTKRLC